MGKRVGQTLAKIRKKQSGESTSKNPGRGRSRDGKKSGLARPLWKGGVANGVQVQKECYGNKGRPLMDHKGSFLITVRAGITMSKETRPKRRKQAKKGLKGTLTDGKKQHGGVGVLSNQWVVLQGDR